MKKGTYYIHVHANTHVAKKLSSLDCDTLNLLLTGLAIDPLSLDGLLGSSLYTLYIHVHCIKTGNKTKYTVMYCSMSWVFS